MAHPARDTWAKALAGRTKAPVCWAGTLHDPVADALDAQRRAFEHFDPACSFHLILEDDAIVGKDFGRRLERLLTNGDDYVYNLFLGLFSPHWSKAHKAEAKASVKKGRWICPVLRTNVGVAYPTRLVPELIEALEKPGPAPDTYETRVRMALKERGVRVWYPIPSLVNHRNTGRSLLAPKLKNTGRVATWWAG